MPVFRPWMRLVAVGYGLVMLLWLSLEDTHTEPVALLGTGFALLSVAGWLIGQYGGVSLAARLWMPGAVLVGALTGAGAALMTTLLMFFKTAQHSHVFPDYPLPMMLAMLQRLPVWGVAGALIGLGVVLIAWSVRASTSSGASPRTPIG